MAAHDLLFIETRLKALIETSKAINSTSEESEILRQVIESALRAIPAANRGSIHFYDEDMEKLILKISSHDYSPDASAALSFAVGEGVAGWVFERQEAVIVADTHADPRYKQIHHPEVRSHRSLLCVPLTSKQRNIGVISLSHSTDADVFTDDDLDLLTGFADQAAVAIENAAQISSIKKEASDLDFLREISLKINAQSKIEDILTAILESGNMLLGTEMAVVHWRGREGGKVQTFAVPPTLQSLKTDPRLDEGLTADIFRSGQPVIIPDTAQDLRVNPDVIQVGIQSLVGLPLRLRGRVAGALFFNSRKPQYFGKQEIHLLSMLLPLAAVAIENAHSIERLERNQRLSGSLVQVSSLLAAEPVLEKQIEALKRFLQEDLAAPMFYMGLYDPVEEAIHLKINYDQGQDQPLFSIPMQKSRASTISSYVVQKQEPILWLTGAQKKSESERLGIEPLKKGTICQSCLAFPLEVEGQILGVISMQSPEPHAWDEIELQTFQTLSHQASIAIRNSDLMREINSSYEHIRKTYVASEKIASELELDKALDVLVSSLCDAVGAIRASAVLINENGKPYHISTSGATEKVELENAVREGGISQGVFRSRQARFFPDTEQVEQELNPKLIREQVKAAACLPLQYKGGSLGVLWVHYDRPHRFLEQEKETLRLFTNQAAIAYENARLFRQVNRARNTAIRVAQITALGDLKNTLDSIVTGVREVLDCDIVTLYIYRQEKEAFDFPPAMAGTLRFPAEVTRTGTIARNAAPYKVIELDDIHVAEDTPNDVILRSPFALRENVRSGVAAPLWVHDRRVGVLFINYCDKPHTFTQEELANIRLFSSQAAVAIRNAILYDEAQKRKEVLRIIDEAGRTVTGSLQLDEIFTNLAHQAYRLTGEKGERASFSTITLVEGSATYLKAAYPPSEAEKIAAANISRIDLEHGIGGRIGIIGRVVKDRAALLVDDVRLHPDYLPADPATRCELAVPIIYRDEVVGVINVEHAQVKGLDEEDLQDLQSLAAHAVIAVQNARMYQALQRKSQLLQAIYESSKIVNAGLELAEEELLNLLLVQMVTKIVPAAGSMNIIGSIHLYDPEKQELKMVCTYPAAAFGEHHSGEVRSLVHPENGKIGITGRAVIEKKPQRSGDVSHDDDYLIYSPCTKSELDVPLLEGQNVLGVLSLECDQCQGFDQDAEDALCAFGELGVIAVKNSRRYQELKETRATVGNITAVAWMGLVASAWRHAIGNMATTISDLSLLVESDLDRKEPPEKIRQRTKKIQDIVAEIQKIPMPPLSSETGVELIHICQLVRDRVNQFRSKDRYASIHFETSFEIGELAMVRASPEWLRRILDILIDNASNAMKRQPEKHIQVVVRPQNGGVEILVIDSGPGIPAHVLPNLFKAPIMKKKDEKGSGIGLFLANTIVQVYGGRLEVRATGPKGTTMALWLPLEK